MGDLVRATGLGKGGIYNHFSGKEELALEAFDYAVEIMRERLRLALEGQETTLEKLFAVVDALGALVEDPPVAGGCPVLNTAVEADDSHPALKSRAAVASTEWLRLVGSLVREGVGSGELRSDVDARAVASIVVAALEGAIMLGRLHDDPAHMRRTTEHLKSYLKSLTWEDA